VEGDSAGLALFHFFWSQVSGVKVQSIAVTLLTIFKEYAEVLQFITGFYMPYKNKFVEKFFSAGTIRYLKT
jgi:hypothetical protein